MELDDIGFIGDGRPITDEESKLASAHIQAYMARHDAAKRKPKSAVAKRTRKETTTKISRKSKG